VREYFEDVYVDPAASRRIDSRRHRLFLDFLDGVRQAGRSRLLDIGCGTGEFIELARARSWNAWGVEVSREAVQTAQGRGLQVALRASEGVEAERLPFADDFFDVIVLWNVIEFFMRPDADLAEIGRVLSPGGRIVVRTQNEPFHLTAYRLHRLFEWLPASHAYLGRSYVFHPLLWSRRTLSDALARAGRLDDARLAFEKMHTYANHLGLYSEEIGSTGEQLGNFPQAFSHLSLISAAVNLDRQLDGGRGPV